MRTYNIVLSAIIAFAALQGCAASTSAKPAAADAAPAPPLPAASELAVLHDTLLRYAQSMGEPSPMKMEIGSSNLGLAMQAAAPGGKPAGDPGESVYMLVAHGRFTDTADVSPWGTTPSGSVLIVVLDSKTHQEVNMTLTSVEPNWVNLGPAAKL